MIYPFALLSTHTTHLLSKKKSLEGIDIVPNDYVNMNISCSLSYLSLFPPYPLTLTHTLHQHILNFLPFLY
jgi:hypothetical protein